MRVVTCAVVLGLVAMVASAAVSTDVLTLVVQADGSAEIVNGTSAAIQFDGYSIVSVTGVLEQGAGQDDPPVVVVDGYMDPDNWRSIHWAAFENNESMTVIGELGLGAIGMSEANPTTVALSELSSGDGATMAAGGSWNLGTPIVIDGRGAAEVEADLEFGFSSGGVAYDGAVQVVPEPATMTLLGLGLAGFIARKRR